MLQGFFRATSCEHTILSNTSKHLRRKTNLVVGSRTPPPPRHRLRPPYYSSSTPCHDEFEENHPSSALTKYRGQYLLDDPRQHPMANKGTILPSEW